MHASAGLPRWQWGTLGGQSGTEGLELRSVGHPSRAPRGTVARRWMGKLWPVPRRNECASMRVTYPETAIDDSSAAGFK